MVDRDSLDKVAKTTAGVGDWAQSRAQPSADLHIRLIRRAKIFLPIAVVLLIALLVAWPNFDDREPGFTLSYSDISNYDDRVRMVRPRYTGMDSQNRPFVVTADAATQTDPDADEVTLQGLTADITLIDGNWLSMTATTAIFRPRDETLNASEGVSLHTNLGYELHTGAAFVDLRASRAHSDQAVKIQGPMGLFEADGFSADLEKQTISLEGHVKATIYPRPR